MFQREINSPRSNSRPVNRPSASLRSRLNCAPPQTDLSMCERYTNRAYNRQPSPMGRFQRPSSGGITKGFSFGRARDERSISHVTDRPREIPPQKSVQSSHISREKAQLPLVHENRSRSVVVKTPPLTMECANQRPSSASHQRRPNTTDRLSTGTSSGAPKFEEKVFFALKDILSRAVIEKGKIDENNIEKILQDMQLRLKRDENEDEDDLRCDINVEQKRSTTAVNTNKSSENIVLRKSRPVHGIVRKELKRLSHNKIHGEYKRVYNKEPSLAQTAKESNPVFYEEPERVVYIDIPDSDYSNFNTMVRQEKERTKKAFHKKVEESADEEVHVPKDHTTRAESFKEGEGDYHVKGSPSCDFWKATEEAKLQSYIESLIRNMNEQVNKQPPQEGSSSSVGDPSTTVCKTFCVCKVCLSPAAHPKESPREREEPTPVRRRDVKEPDDRPKSRGRSGTSIVASGLSRMREPRVGKEESNVHFKVLKRNKNFQPESNMNINPRSIMGPTAREDETKGCCAIVPAEEAAEEMYLKRRISQFVVNKKMNTRI